MRKLPISSRNIDTSGTFDISKFFVITNYFFYGELMHKKFMAVVTSCRVDLGGKCREHAIRIMPLFRRKTKEITRAKVKNENIDTYEVRIDLILDEWKITFSFRQSFTRRFRKKFDFLRCNPKAFALIFMALPYFWIKEALGIFFANKFPRSTKSMSPSPICKPSSLVPPSARCMCACVVKQSQEMR